MKQLAQGLVLLVIGLAACLVCLGFADAPRGTGANLEGSGAGSVEQPLALGALLLETNERAEPQLGEIADPVRSAVESAAPGTAPVASALELSPPDPNGACFEVVIEGSGHRWRARC